MVVFDQPFFLISFLNNQSNTKRKETLLTIIIFHFHSSISFLREKYTISIIIKLLRAIFQC